MVTMMLLTLPVLAAESVIIKIEFNTASNEAFTATVLGGSGCVSASSPSQCADAISFNCSAGSNGNCAWVNATCVGEDQDPYTANKAASWASRAAM